MAQAGRSSFKDLVFALLAQLVGGVVCGLFAWMVCGAERFAPAGLALALLVPPTFITHALSWLVGRDVPEFVVYAALLSSGLRMLWAVMATFGLGDLVRTLGGTAAEFGNWMVGFYLVGLTIQIGLLVFQVQRSQDVKAG